MTPEFDEEVVFEVRKKMAVGVNCLCFRRMEEARRSRGAPACLSHRIPTVSGPLVGLLHDRCSPSRPVRGGGGLRPARNPQLQGGGLAGGQEPRGSEHPPGTLRLPWGGVALCCTLPCGCFGEVAVHLASSPRSLPRRGPRPEGSRCRFSDRIAGPRL